MFCRRKHAEGSQFLRSDLKFIPSKISQMQEDFQNLGDYPEVILDVNVTLNLVSHPKGFRALKHFSLTGHPWLSMWDLEMKLQRKRCADPALSWADRCEGPSMR